MSTHIAAICLNELDATDGGKVCAMTRCPEQKRGIRLWRSLDLELILG